MYKSSMYISICIYEATNYISIYLSIYLSPYQNTFMEGLSADYGRWATDSDYRDVRRAGGHVPRPARHRFTRID